MLKTLRITDTASGLARFHKVRAEKNKELTNTSAPAPVTWWTTGQVVRITKGK